MKDKQPKSNDAQSIEEQATIRARMIKVRLMIPVLFCLPVGYCFYMQWVSIAQLTVLVVLGIFAAVVMRMAENKHKVVSSSLPMLLLLPSFYVLDNSFNIFWHQLILIIGGAGISLTALSVTFMVLDFLKAHRKAKE